MQGINVNALQAQRCYRFTVGDTGKTLTLPTRCASLTVYNDGNDELYVQLGRTIPTAPAGASSTIVETPKIIKASYGWAVDLAAKDVSFIAPAGKTIEIRVEALFQVVEG